LRTQARYHWLIFGIWTLLGCLLFAKPIFALVQLAVRDDTASHILLIPFLSAWLIYTEGRDPVSGNGLAPLPSTAFLAPSVLLAVLSSRCDSCSPKDHLSLLVLSLILLLIAGYVLILGTSRAKTGWFGLAFLLFAAPIPDLVLEKVIYGLQAGSAAVAEFLFNLSGAPVLRDGFVFRLPKMSIEVAQECSGIRSSLALAILALLVAHFSFRPFWKKSVFMIAGLFMMLVKNGVRIATLTLLANYVNPNFLYGGLHRDGGVVFFLIGRALLWPVYWLLRKGEAIPAGVARTTGEA
jgi:exosortase